MSECQGHPSGPFDPMGQTVYCDGSCNPQWELQIHDQAGPDLSFECDSRDEGINILNSEYPASPSIDWSLIDPSGRIVDGTR